MAWRVPRTLARYIAVSASRSRWSDALGGRTAERDADGGAGEDLVAFDQERRRERAVDALCDGNGLVLGGGAFDEQRELVAAQARHGVAARGGSSPAARAICDQQVVAGAVAQRIVDELEAVQVEEHDREARGLAAGGAGEGHFQAVLEERAIGQAGQSDRRRPPAAAAPAPCGAG